MQEFHYLRAMCMLKIKDWNPEDRPREKMLAHGPDALTDAELVAILLRSGTRSETALEIGKRVLSLGHNNLDELGKIAVAQLQKINGIGTTKALTLIAALELGRRRAASEAKPRAVIRSAGDVVQLMGPRLGDLPHEEIWLLLLNSANRVMEQVLVSRGGVQAAVMDRRIILQKAIEKLATGIVLVHNHPSGNAKPSGEDIRQTERLKCAVELFDIRLTDHVIVAGKGYYSFADKGQL